MIGHPDLPQAYYDWWFERCRMLEGISEESCERTVVACDLETSRPTCVWHAREVERAQFWAFDTRPAQFKYQNLGE